MGETAPEHDAVNHPKHYTGHPSGVECIVITRHMNFNLGNVVKYVWRAGHKDEAPTIQDLKKAAWYLNDEIERREKEEAALAVAQTIDEGLDRIIEQQGEPNDGQSPQPEAG